MLVYSVPEMFEINVESIDMMCACTADDANPWMVQY